MKRQKLGEVLRERGLSTRARQANREAIPKAQALGQKATPAVRIVSAVIRAATQERASDIHR